MKAVKGGLIALVVVLALGLCVWLGGFAWYRSSHVSVNETVYRTDTDLVDLRGEKTTVEEYENLRKEFPDAVIRWDVPFQETSYPDDTREIRVEQLSPEDVEQLRYLPQLEHVDAMECRDYEALQLLQQTRPDCQVDYQIHVGSHVMDRGTEHLELTGREAGEEAVTTAVRYLPNLKTLELVDPEIPAQQLLALQEENPELEITWVKKFGENYYSMHQVQIDVSGTKFESLQQVEDLAAYFPSLRLLIMDKCGFENEDMASFRDKVRDRYKVVWGVQVGEAYLMTDVIGFTPGNLNTRVRNEDTYNLRYCEDLLAVDFGHIGISNLEWVVGTPHLKYLILGDGNVFNEDIKPLSCLKELEWLEIFNSPVTDVSPLVGCTSLKDLLLSGSYIDVEPLGQIPSLENIWLLRSGIDGKDIMYLREHLPNTHLEVADTPHAHSHGWRLLPRYYDMRDALGMWYMGG